MTITSGVTTLEDALNYTADSQVGGSDRNGRFNGNSFGTVSYNYTDGGLDLDGLLLWNYNEGSSNQRGIDRADITITHSGGSLVLNDQAFALTPDNMATPVIQVAFGHNLTGVTQISLSDLQGDDGTFRGWQEVAVYAVPEPSSTALLGLADLGLILRRRRH